MGLRAAAREATWVTLILSDVLGNDPRVIASGPTVPDARDPRCALEVIERYGVEQQVPGSSSCRDRELRSVEPEPRRDRTTMFCSSSATMPRRLRRRQTRRGALGLECRIVWQAAKARPPSWDANSSRVVATCRTQSTLFSAVERQR